MDVIVNTASADLNLSHGAVSASILKIGGDSIQQECQLKYPNGINPGEVAVTSGGRLACKIVCHGALPKWDKESGESKKVGSKFNLILFICSTSDFCKMINFLISFLHG